MTIATESQYVQEGESLDYTAAVALAAGEVRCGPDGRAMCFKSAIDPSTANTNVYPHTGAGEVCGIFRVLKTASICFLDGGKVYWDYSANKAHFKSVNDQDFYLGVAVGDAASADTDMLVNINVLPRYIQTLADQPATSVIVGTAAAGGLGWPRRIGGSNVLALTATSEAQKNDLLADEGFTIVANPIVEMRINITDGDSSTAADYNVGIASATHASDADAIAKHFFMHADGNSTKINFQSKDGTTTVTAQDSTKTFTVGTAFEVWMDFRDPTNVKTYVDGVATLPATFDVSAWSGQAYLLAHLEKTSSTDTAAMKVDWLRARIADQ